jgi:hypothetical protein
MVTLSSTTAVKPTFTSPTVFTATALTFQLVVNDGKVNSTPDTVVITVQNNIDEPPVANAGPDQTVAEGVMVSLTALGSTDPNGDTLSYSWTQLTGPAVTLTGAATATPTFTSPPVVATTTLSFRVTVSDGKGGTSTDDVVITENNTVDEAPVANAGPDQSVGEAAPVQLDGSASSDPNGQSLTYLWLQLSGPAVTLSSSTVAQPTFTSPRVVATTMLTFSLIVSDGTLSSAPATIVVTVNDTINEPPVANAGPDFSVGEQTSVMLDGSGSSDPNGETLMYQWTQTSGPAVTLMGATTAQPGFTSPQVTVATALSFMLTVTDPRGGTSSDTVVVTVNDTSVGRACSDRERELAGAARRLRVFGSQRRPALVSMGAAVGPVRVAHRREHGGTDLHVSFGVHGSWPRPSCSGSPSPTVAAAARRRR